MNNTDSLPEEFVRSARLRGGVFTTTQSREHHVSPSHLTRALAEGHCHRLQPGLYCLEAEPDIRSRIWGALLHAGPQAVLGGEAAAHLRGEGPEPDVIDVWTGHRNLKNRLPWRFHPGQPPAPDDPADVDEEFGTLATMRNFSPELARERAQSLLALSDRERFLKLATHAAQEGLSVIETLFRKRVERSHGLPEATWEPVPDGERTRLMTKFEPYRTRVVLDGAAIGRHNIGSWLPRRPEHTIYRSGEDAVLTISWADLMEAPCTAAHKLAELLWLNGWLGLFPECRRCNHPPFVPDGATLYAFASSGGWR